MTDNSLPHNSATEPERDLAVHRLSRELDIAMRRARDQQPEPDDVIRCIRNAQGMKEAPAIRRKSVSFVRPLTLIGSLTAAAAAVYLMVDWNTRPVIPERDQPPVVLLPVYSTVSQISLAEVGYRRIEADLDQAETELAQASEAIGMSAVRLEVQQTLEEFYDWSDPGE